jgi:mRNA interferase HigB
MQVFSRSKLRDFWERHPQAEAPLRTWYAMANEATWSRPTDVEQWWSGKVRLLADNRVLFNIGGNDYRLVVRVSYGYGRVMVKWVGTHAEYDRIDPLTVGRT